MRSSSSANNLQKLGVSMMMMMMMMMMLLLLIQFGWTVAFQPSLPFSRLDRQLLSLRSPPLIFQTASSASLDDAAVTANIATSDYDEALLEVDYNWDEQYEKLLSFKTEYGHPNFPQNASTELNEKYPLLARFCRDQLQTYKKYIPYEDDRRYKCPRTLKIFNRDFCYSRLEEIGFEFNPRLAKWYERYHELIDYRHKNGHVHVKEMENHILFGWISTQRKRRKGEKGLNNLSDTQLELLDNIGFVWESQSHDAIWMLKYNELVDFRNQHGHLLVTEDFNLSLYRWMYAQRKRRAGARCRTPLTAERIRLLDEIEFPWNPEVVRDTIWKARYDELVQFHMKHGHSKPVRSKDRALCFWSRSQRKKRDEGLLSAQQIELLDKIDFPWQGGVFQWPKMFAELDEYCSQHDHLRVCQDDNPDLYDWMTLQRKRYHGIVTPAMPERQIEMLEEVHFCWSQDRNDRIWHEKYTEAVEFYKDHGHARVVENENPSLHNWIESKGKRYNGTKGQKPLSDEELELLEYIDFSFFDNQPRITWNTMYAELVKYQEENDGRFPNHKDDPILNRWMRHQRKRLRSSYGYVPLSDEQKALLDSIGFPILPNTKNSRRWYEMYDELVAFWKRHGNFFVAIDPNNARLSGWVLEQRKSYKRKHFLSHRPLPKSKKYLLQRIGFPWTSDRTEVKWQRKYAELVKFQEEHGHLGVKEFENNSLYNWVIRQRGKYNGNGYTYPDIPDHQIKLLETIGFQWSTTSD